MFEMSFIGAGNMGSALAGAASKVLDGNSLSVSNRTRSKAETLAALLGCVSCSNEEAAASAKYLVLAVKPQMMAEMLAGISGILKRRTDRFILVTIAAGLSISRIQNMADGEYPVIRIMPNTPCSIGNGVILCCRNSLVSDEEFSRFKEIMKLSGTLIDVNENMIDAGSAISGCGPAYVCTFVEAMADAGVSLGLTRKDSIRLAAATVMGSAEMILQTGNHPAQLRDNVCSPGGSTIAGVLSLENDGFRAAVSNCIIAAYEKTLELGK